MTVSTTNVLLIAVLGLVGWVVLKPYLSELNQNSSNTSTTSGSGGSSPVGGGSNDFWENVMGTLNDIFAAANKQGQANPKTL